MDCPKCSSSNTKKVGFDYYKGTKTQRFKCKNCQARFRDYSQERFRDLEGRIEYTYISRRKEKVSIFLTTYSIIRFNSTAFVLIKKVLDNSFAFEIIEGQVYLTKDDNGFSIEKKGGHYCIMSTEVVGNIKTLMGEEKHYQNAVLIFNLEPQNDKIKMGFLFKKKAEKQATGQKAEKPFITIAKVVSHCRFSTKAVELMAFEKGDGVGLYEDDKTKALYIFVQDRNDGGFALTKSRANVYQQSSHTFGDAILEKFGLDASQNSVRIEIAPTPKTIEGFTMFELINPA